MPLDRDANFYVAGHGGMVGSAIWRVLEREGFTNLIGKRSKELDLRQRELVIDFFEETRPKYVVLAAARVGGILANNSYPADFISENLQIQVNVMDAASKVGTERLLFLGSSCIYPKFAPQPIREESLLTGHLEPTNDAYAIAKISGIIQVQAVRRQYGLHWISAMPTNLFGIGDNYTESSSHVIPSLIKRYEDARKLEMKIVSNWGTGTPLRDFLYVDDLASACLHLLENYDGAEHINIGSGQEISIREIADIIANLTGYRGETFWDTSMPDGTPRKLLDISKALALGWRPRTSIQDGLRSAIQDFRLRN